MRETIKEGLASIAWWMAWLNHAEEHRCANLSGERIEEIAPKVPAEILERAEEALQKIEARIEKHAPTCEVMARGASYFCCEDSVSVSDRVLYAAAILDIESRRNAQFQDDSSASDLYEDPDYARRFGECLGYAVAGAGVSWSDDHAEVPLPDLYYCSDIIDRARDIAESTCEHGKPESED